MAASRAGTAPGVFELGPFFPDARASEALLERAAELVAEGHRLQAANAPLAAALRPLSIAANACHDSALDARPLHPSELAPAATQPADPRRRAALAAARAHCTAETALVAALPQRSVALYAPEFVQCIHAELHRRAAPLAPGDELLAAASQLARSASDARDASGADPAPPRATASVDDHDLSPDSTSPDAPAHPLARDTSNAGDPRAPRPAALDAVAPCPSPTAADAPGALRAFPVAAGRGAAPSEIPDLLDLWQGVYGKPFAPEQAVIAALCAGQRLLLLRPFERGNGATARLHTQLALTALGVTQGSWSPLAAMATDRDAYRQHLRRAVGSTPLEARRHALGDYAEWLLDACLSEARAARERLDPSRLERRLAATLAWLAAHPWTIGSERSVIKSDALAPLHYAAITGPVERARFIAMLGLPHRTARRVLSSLLDCGLLASDSSRASVRFNVPWPAQRLLFPDIWPETTAASAAAAASPWPTRSRAATSGAHAIALAPPTEDRSAAG